MLGFFAFFLFPLSAHTQGASLYLSGTVTADAVDMHAEPSLESKPLGQVEHGARVKIYELQAGWLLVGLHNGEEGWIKSEYITTAPTETGASLPGTTTPQPSYDPATPRPGRTIPQPTPQPYRIHVGDTILIRSFRVPEINSEVIVRPDGCISLLLVDDVHVSGLTPSEVDAYLTEQYSKYLKKPDLTVILHEIKEVRESKVFVGGEVRIPQEVPLPVPTTVLQAIIAAGGFLNSAKPDHVVLIRKGNENQPLLYKLDLKDVKGGGAIKDNVYLQPFDIVYVPRTKVAQVGKFVDQYMNQIVPDFVSTGFMWFIPY